MTTWSMISRIKVTLLGMTKLVKSGRASKTCNVLKVFHS